MRTFDAIKAAVNLGSFPDGVEDAMKELIKKMNEELTSESWEEGPDVISACEDLEIAINEAETTEDLDEADEEEEDEGV